MSEIILGPIVGGLSHESAKLWARADGPATLYAWYGQKVNLSDAKLAGKFRLSNEPFAGVIPLKELTSSTRIFYAVTLKSSPPKADSVYPSFQTFPKPGQKSSFNFSFGSCFLPGKAGSGIVFDALDKCRAEEDLRFILMIGDQIYADDCKYNGLGHAAISLENYRKVYANSWSNPHLRHMLTNLPAFMILDDHEVDNDWHWNDTGRRWAHIPFYEQFLRWLKRRALDELFLTIHRVRDAMQAYWEHQGIHADNYINLPKMDAAGRFMFHNDNGFLAYTFQFGVVPFFVLDTRTARVENWHERHLLGETQWQALEKWLLDNRAAPVKFLVSSSTVMFDMFVDFTGDRWGGFQKDRSRLLKFIADNDIQNLYILSGDLHNAHCIETDLRGKNGPLKLWEFCSSPFEQQPNVASYTYIRPWDNLIKRQKLHARLVTQNFGVVKVDLTESNPRVRYEIHGQDGKLLYASS